MFYIMMGLVFISFIVTIVRQKYYQNHIRMNRILWILSTVLLAIAFYIVCFL